MLFADVLLPLAFSGETFTYSYGSTCGIEPQIGVRVTVPIGNRLKVAIIVDLHQRNPNLQNIKELGEVLDSKPILTPQQIELMRWVASYYLSPVGLVLKNYLPKAISSGSYQLPTIKGYLLAQGLDMESTYNQLHKKKAATAALDSFLACLDPSALGALVSHRELVGRGISLSGLRQLIEGGLLIEKRMEPRRFRSSRERTSHEYTPEVMALSDKIAQENRPILLYNRNQGLLDELIEKQIELNSQNGKLSVIITPDSYSATRIAQRLERKFEVLEHHAQITSTTRNKGYYRLLDHPQSLDVVVGTRSALMLPLQDLGLVIVIQESDFGHKSNDRAPHLSGRDLALVLANQSRSKILLTTIAPSLESFAMCKYQRWARVDVGDKKEIKIKLLEKGKKQLFSSYMIRRISETLEQSQQVLVLQNRRGFASSLFCQECGYTPTCQRCNVTLTIHQTTQEQKCHYCGYTIPLRMSCAGCGSPNVTAQGMGTERVVEQLQTLFPLAHIARVDSDSVEKKEMLSDQNQASIEADIIVGTQMLLRGIEPQRAALAVVVNADNMFLSTDFRTSERAMLSLMRFRSMVNHSGEMIIQSWNIQNPVLKALEWDEINSFYQTELSQRQELGYPPMVRLIIIRLYAKGRGVLIAAATELDNSLAKLLGDRVSPPYEPVIDRLQERFILEIMVRLERDQKLEANKKALYQKINEFRKSHSAIDLVVDVDPL